MRRSRADSGNPFLPATTATALAEAPDPGDWDDLLGGDVVATGSPAPLGTPAPPKSPLTRAGTPTTGRVHVVGLHGGAGASTITGWLGTDLAVDCGRDVPAGSGFVLLLAARTHAQGLARVIAAGQAWSAGQLPGVAVLGVVLNADAPAPARELHPQLKRSLRVLPLAWRMPWVEQWRSGAEPDLSRTPLRVKRTRNSLIHESVRLLRAAREGKTSP